MFDTPTAIVNRAGSITFLDLDVGEVFSCKAQIVYWYENINSNKSLQVSNVPSMSDQRVMLPLSEGYTDLCEYPFHVTITIINCQMKKMKNSTSL
jgi:hypothetical protein